MGTLKKIKNIEEIASMLISASEDDGICDDHQPKLPDHKSEESCTECYSTNTNFEKCKKHNCIVLVDCEKCEDQKKMIKKFQTHNHTFTCKKKRKGMTIKENEGHGRLDGRIEGQRIQDYSECRFKFPQFPMNKTRLILRASKDLDKDELP